MKEPNAQKTFSNEANYTKVSCAITKTFKVFPKTPVANVSQ